MADAVSERVRNGYSTTIGDAAGLTDSDKFFSKVSRVDDILVHLQRIVHRAAVECGDDDIGTGRPSAELVHCANQAFVVILQAARACRRRRRRCTCTNPIP